MKRMVVAFLALGVAGAVVPAFAQQPPQPANLQLQVDKVSTDPAGAFINIRVKNVGTVAISQIDVGCQFLAKGKVIGTSSTTLFASVPGVTGIGQVRLMGATNATDARCGILKAS
ncbi:conserved hypothetical protein [Azorhizobium caulinodans ORS 571]|uniref:Uncharacterized protein n=2 Tax=Xanthobacteraceae TaxID=335928 RepID=A8HQ53_AZOC5|nr:hypothetical protein DFO45_3540 [Azorhizobium sp. AG788]BAF87017.1 conserved hypothetical protein [Azorhizobium caulinodans ORS 571]